MVSRYHLRQRADAMELDETSYFYLVGVSNGDKDPTEARLQLQAGRSFRVDVSNGDTNSPGSGCGGWPASIVTGVEYDTR